MTSAEDPAEVFARKAPLLAREELATIVREDLLAPAVRERCREVWLYGSFANPYAVLDEDGTASHLAIYVVVDPSILPNPDAKLSTRFFATQPGLLCRLAAQGVLDVYGQDEPLDEWPPDAPAPLVESLYAAERTAFLVREDDRKHLRFRGLALKIGARATLDEFLAADPALRLWARDK